MLCNILSVSLSFSVFNLFRAKKINKMSIIKKLILNSEVYRLKKLRMKLETQINNYLKLQLKVMKDYASVVEDDELLGKKLIEYLK